MKKYLVHHRGRDATYDYFLSQCANGYVLSILYYDRIRDCNKPSEIMLDMKIAHIAASSEEDVIKKAAVWVTDNLGPDFEIRESTET